MSIAAVPRCLSEVTMKDFKIANILLDESRQFYTTPLLYYRSARAIFPSSAEDGAWRLVGPGSFDFTTFFNALSIGKWREYTVAEGFTLHLELRGAACTVTQTRTDALDYYSHKLPDTARSVEASQEWQTVDMSLVLDDNDVMDAFIIDAEGEVELRNSYYTAQVPDGSIRPIELALSTTTFKKEEFIKHNIELVRTKIVETDELISKHFRMYVVDNGRTLDAEKLSSRNITVFPNDNVGGSGGFTYGMIKALEEGDVTNILLMDDDVEVSPESIIRTFNLLSITNEKYSEAFVSGSMMNYDEPDQHWEDTGHMTVKGNYMPDKPPMRVSALNEAIACETFSYEKEIFADLKQRYAGWWYCCIPVSTIKKIGLPLPFFVRFDDAEYALRAKPRFMSMNGICVWHLVFFMRYSAAVERYQVTRNGLIGQFTTGVAPLTDFFTEINHEIMIELSKFNYDDAELVLEGLEDFFKGPKFIAQRGIGEKTFMAANRKKEKLLPFDELREQALKECKVDIYDLSPNAITDDIPMKKASVGRVENVALRTLERKSLNGQLWGDLKPFIDSVPVIHGVGWSCQEGKLFGADTLIAIDNFNKKGIIRHKNADRAKQIWSRYQNDLKYYRQNKERLKKEYRASKAYLTSIDFWKSYLSL